MKHWHLHASFYGQSLVKLFLYEYINCISARIITEMLQTSNYNVKLIAESVTDLTGHHENVAVA